MSKIIGREKELAEFNTLYNSGTAQLVAVYGRRRVGKTFLIDEALKGRITFRHAGLSPINEKGGKSMLKDQLKHFYNARNHGLTHSSCWRSIWNPLILENAKSYSLMNYHGWTHLVPVS